MRPIISTTYTGRPKLTYIVTEALDFLITEDDRFLVTEDSFNTIYTPRTPIATTYS